MGHTSRLGGPSTSDGAGLPGVDKTSLVVGADGQARPVAKTLTSTPLPVASGGTGAASASAARTALGLGTAATSDATAFTAAAVASGTATLSSGTRTVSNASVTANTIIRLSYASATTGAVFVSALNAGASFVITSTSNTDSGKVYWEVVSW